MSTRGLPEDHAMEDYLVDLEAVVERLSLERFVLYGGPLSNHVAIRYAIHHPESVTALVLGDVTLDSSMLPPGYRELARQDWALFLHTIASSFSLQGAPIEVAYWRQSVEQADYLRAESASRQSDITTLLPELSVPTLILNARRLRADEPESRLAEHGRAMAAVIPDGRLVLYDGFASVWYSGSPEPPAAVPMIEAFLASIPGLNRTPGATVRTTRLLSSREIQVLQLIARGSSNQQIADDLVLSVRTVERHITNVYAKIGARGRADATAYAVRAGLD
jgi:DNA-binding CsgD family transcriptional regulator